MKHAGDAVGIALGEPFLVGQLTREFGRIFGKENQPAVVHMGEQLGEAGAVGGGSDGECIDRKSTKQVDEDGVVAIPGIEEGFEKFVWHVDFSGWKDRFLNSIAGRNWLEMASGRGLADVRSFFVLAARRQVFP